MIVKCKKCGKGYNCGENYHGKKFACTCGAVVEVSEAAHGLHSSSAPKPVSGQKPAPKPAAKPVPSTTKHRSLMDVLATAPLSSIGATLSEIRGYASGKQTVYGLMAQISSVACFLVLVMAGVGMWKGLEHFELIDEKVLVFVFTFIPVMFLVIFAFAVGTAILRIADCVCRSSGVRPTLF